MNFTFNIFGLFVILQNKLKIKSILVDYSEIFNL